MAVCKECKEEVKSIYGGVCQQCRIGNQNPAQWALEQVRTKMINHYRSVNYKPKLLTGYESLHYHIDGHYLNELYHTHEIRDQIVSISMGAECTPYDRPDSLEPGCKDIKFYIRRWTTDGLRSYRKVGPVPISNIDTFVEEALPHFHEALLDLLKFAKTDSYVCATCDKTFPNDVFGGSYFAGKYCSPCWELFKKKNSRECLKCRRSRYECYC
jgi:hypothetical protein